MYEKRDCVEETRSTSKELKHKRIDGKYKIFK